MLLRRAVCGKTARTVLRGVYLQLFKMSKVKEGGKFTYATNRQ